jgi:hypothetical protein
MRFVRGAGIAAFVFIAAAGAHCASVESAMREKHAELVSSSDREIAEARARVTRAHDGEAALGFAALVVNAIRDDRGYQGVWASQRFGGAPPQRVDSVALVAEAARYLDEVATLEPAKAPRMRRQLGEVYEAVPDLARAAAAFEGAVTPGFDQEAFEHYARALDQSGRVAEIKGACKRFWPAQAAGPVEGTVSSPDGERPRTGDDARYEFLATCVKHQHGIAADAALDWATPADRDFYAARDRHEGASRARWQASRDEERRQAERASTEKSARTKQDCLTGCKGRQDECLTWCHGGVSCHNGCVEHANECVERCGQ